VNTKYRISYINTLTSTITIPVRVQNYSTIKINLFNALMEGAIKSMSSA